MQTVVVGGSGFLGGAVVDTLASCGHDVTVFDVAGSQERTDARHGPGAARYVRGDVRDFDAVMRVFRGADEVYDFAGVLGTAELDDEMPEAVTTNVLGAVHQFEAAVRQGVPRLLYASKPNVWLNTYSITKAAAEAFAALYNERGETRICALRYFNAFGPHQSLVPIRKIVPMFAALAMRGRPLEVFGDGEQIVDLVYSPDLARLTVQFLAEEHSDGVVDCGRGVGLTVNDVARAVNEVTANPGGIRHLPMRRGEDERSVLIADLEVLSKLVGEPCFTDLEASLVDTIDWYRRLPADEIDLAVARLCA
jgi:nucleoside-diphosphate-sugar epimerase